MSPSLPSRVLLLYVANVAWAGDAAAAGAISLAADLMHLLACLTRQRFVPNGKLKQAVFVLAFVGDTHSLHLADVKQLAYQACTHSARCEIGKLVVCSQAVPATSFCAHCDCACPSEPWQAGRTGTGRLAVPDLHETTFQLLGSCTKRQGACRAACKLAAVCMAKQAGGQAHSLHQGFQQSSSLSLWKGELQDVPRQLTFPQYILQQHSNHAGV